MLTTDMILTRHDDYEWYVQLVDTDGGVLPLRDVELIATAKPLTSDQPDDSDAIYRHTAHFAADGSLSSAVGIRLGGTSPYPPYTVATGVDEGIVTEFLTPDDVAALADAYDATQGRDAKVIARWDMQVRDAQGRRKTVLSGTISMTRDVGQTLTV